jgi:hypothetical protein
LVSETCDAAESQVAASPVVVADGVVVAAADDDGDEILSSDDDDLDADTYQETADTGFKHQFGARKK